MKINDSRSTIWFDLSSKRGGSKLPDGEFSFAESTSPAGGAVAEAGGTAKFAAALSGMAADGTDERRTKARASGEAVEQEFSTWSKMSPAEKIRELILRDHSMTEESLRALPPEERAKIEDEIAEAIKRHYGFDDPDRTDEAPKA